MGKVGNQGEGIARLYQRINGLLVVAEENLIGASAAHDPALNLKKLTGAGGRASGRDALCRLELTAGDRLLLCQRVARSTDTHHRAAGQLQIPGL